MERFPDGEFPSVCRGCHGGCAVRLAVEGGRLVRARPLPGSPMSLGRMCVKGLAAVETVYHPDRLSRPLKRVGERGSGAFSPISWDQALGEIAERLGRVRETHGPEAVALGQGTGRPYYFHVMRLANMLGTPNWYEPGLANCLIPRVTAANLTHGGFVAGDFTGAVRPETILFWGRNPVVSNPDGELAGPVLRALRRGARGIAIDPRRSETARRCALWLPIRPGTDAALALAMIRLIIDEGWLDRDFVSRHCLGLAELTERVAPATAAWAESVTGVEAGLIRAAAERYALSRPSILDWGVSADQTPNSLQTARALCILRGLTGNLDVPGADVFGHEMLRPYPTLHQLMPPGQAAKRLGADRFKLLGGFRAYLPSAHIPTLFSAMRTGSPYPVRALLLFGNNPLLTVANPEATRRALASLDLLVAADLFMTPSAALADYVLPAASWPEADQIMELPLVASRAVFAQRAVVRVGERRQIETIIDDLAARLGLPGSGTRLADILEYRLEPLGLTFEAFKERFMVVAEPAYRRFADKGFRTPSRKVEFFCKALARLGYDPLPAYVEPPESPLSRPDLAARFPLVLTTGARRSEYFHSEGRQIAALRSRRPRPLAELHPDTAGPRGIAEGDRVAVSSPRGVVTAWARVTPDIRPGVVGLDHGWWFPERGPDGDAMASNANVLTEDGPPYDPAMGSYQLRGLLCEIRPEGASGPVDAARAAVTDAGPDTDGPPR